MMRMLGFWVLIIVSQAAAAEFENGMRAYESRDFATAVPAMADAAGKGDSDAQFVLGRMYANGNGVLQDFVEAYKWYNLAASNGQRLAAIARDILAERMTEIQVSDAQARARAWQSDSEAASETVISTPGAQPEFEANETTVTQVQLNLKRLGYDVGTINGQMNDQTQAEIERYQSENNLPLGAITARLIRHLNNNSGPQPTIRRSEPTIVPDSGTPASSNFRKLL